jgi:2-iminoacetate synthase ThiH
LKKQYPQLHLKAFTMVEFDHFAHFYKMSDEDVIKQLIEAGFGLVSGRRRGDLSRAHALDDLSRTNATQSAGWSCREKFTPRD